MSQTGLEVFDTTIQTTNIWLNDINKELGWGDRQLAYHALRSVLQSLRDRVQVEVAAQVGAQLPLLVRGIYYDGFQPAQNPVTARSQEEFLKLVEERYNHREPIDFEDVTRAVFKVLNKHLTPELVNKVRTMLGAELQPLWPDLARA